jgi:hypothetical protein
VLVFLQSIANGERTSKGGRGVLQRIKRIAYEVFSTVHKFVNNNK